eukprot:12430726-Karenia_brevis.AAC.1
MSAILGSCPRSLPSVRSGLKCYMAFVDACFKKGTRYFPPQVEVLAAWATLFRCAGTYSNYLGH